MKAYLPIKNLSVSAFVVFILSCTTTFGQVQVGTGQTYETLKDAFDAINDGTLTGDVVLEIAADCNETPGLAGVAELVESGVGDADYSSVLIYPAGGTRTISTNSTTRMIDLNGADNVTIDGRLNGTGTPHSLIIENESTADLATAITIRGGAADNIVQNCIIRGSSIGGTGKIIDIGGVDTPGNNNNNRIQFNELTQGAGGAPRHAIFSRGNFTCFNPNNIIHANNFYDLGIHRWIQVAENSTGWVISENSFYQTAPLTIDESIIHEFNFIFFLDGVQGMQIVDNYFGGSEPNAGGVPFQIDLEAGQFKCIDGQPGTGPIMIYRNQFTNFEINSSVTNPFMAISARGNGHWLIGSTGNGNVFGDLATDDAILINGVAAAGINPKVINHVSTAQNSSIEGNSFGGITFSYTPTSAFPVFNLISLGSGGRAVINENNFGSANASIKLRGLGRAIAYKMIDWSTAANAEITNNTFQNFDVETTPDGGANDEALIYFFGEGNHLVDNNTIGSTTANNMRFNTNDDVYGIHIYSRGNFTVTNNTIQNFIQERAGTNASLTPIYVDFFSNDTEITIANNTIRNCTTNSSRSAIASTLGFTGIHLGGSSSIVTPTHVVNNTISGITSTGAGGLKGIFNQSGASLVEKNRFFDVNANGGRLYGIHINSSNNVDVFNNVVLIDFNGVQPEIRGLMDNSTANKNLRVYHNTIKVAGEATSGDDASNVFTYIGANGTPDIQNNIFQNVRTNTGASAQQIGVRYTGTPGGVFDYNWVEASGNGGVFGVWNNDNESDLPAFQSASGQAENVTTGTISIDGNGEVTDFAPENVQNTGTDLQAIVPDDIETLAIRPTCPWMGAYEGVAFVPTFSISITPSAPVCIGGDVFFELELLDGNDDPLVAHIIYAINGGASQEILTDANGQALVELDGVSENQTIVVTAIRIGACEYEVNPNEEETIAVNDIPTLVAEGVNPPTCGDDARIDFTFTNVPDGDYTITFDGGEFENVNVENNEVSVVVTDGDYTNLQIAVAGCESALDENVTIDAPNVPTLTADGTNPTTCGGEGTISFTFTDVPNGTYTITYDGGEFEDVEVENNAATVNAVSGVYNDLQITVSGCENVEGVNVSLDDPNAPTLSATGVNPTGCGENGSINFTFTDVPNGTYTITYDGGEFEDVEVENNAATVTDVAVNDYTNLQLTAAGCTSAGGVSVSVVGPSEPVLEVLSVNQPTECGETGSILISVSNIPDGAYTISYDGGNFTLVDINGGDATISAVAGSYENLVIAYQGCLSQLGENAVLTDPDAPVLSLTDVSSPSTCGGSDGEIIINVSGNTDTSFDFEYDNGVFSAINLIGGEATIEAGTGTYTNITITENNCQSNAITVEVEDPSSTTTTPSISTNSPICTNEDAVFELTGAANNTVTYTLDNGATTENVQLDASGQATITVSEPTANVVLELIEVTDGVCPELISISSEVEVQQVLIPIVTCGETTASSVTFEWDPIPGATGYTLNYDIIGQGAQPSVLGHQTTSYEVTDLSPNDEVTIVVIPEGGNVCFEASAITACQANDCVSPTITEQPQTVSVCLNEEAVFSVEATDAFSYEWQVSTDGGGQYETITDGAVYTGASTSVLTVEDVADLDGNRYRVLVHDELGECSTISSIANLNVLALPSVPSVTAESPICFGDDGVFTISGQVNTVVMYTINGGATETVTLLGGTATISVSNVEENQVLNIVSVENASCQVDVTGLTSTINVNELPASVSITSNSPVCSGDDAIFTIEGTPGDVVTYRLNGVQGNLTIGGSGTNQITVTSSINNEELEIVSVFDGNCTRTIGLMEQTVVVLPITPVLTTNSPICSGEEAVFTITGTPGDIVTYSINGVALLEATIAPSGSVDIVESNVQNNQTITLWNITDGTCNKTLGMAATVVITSSPNEPQISATSPICAGEDALFEVSGQPGATVHYTINGGAIQTGTVPANGVLVVTIANATEDQLVEVVEIEANSCTTEVLDVSASVSVTPQPLITNIVGADATECGGLGTLTFTFENVLDGTYTINYAGGVFTDVEVSSNSATVDVNAGSYSDFSITVGDCSGSNSSSITIVTPDQPDAPEVTGETFYCQGEELEALEATGDPDAEITWYTDANLVFEAGSGETFVPLENVGTTTYFVTQTVDNCQSGATQIEVTIQVAPAPPIANSTSTFCTSDEGVELFANGNAGGSITWYLDEDLTVFYSSENLVSPIIEVGTTSYYVTETVNGCEGLPAVVTIEFENCDFLLPTAFTPDADGVNDTWLIPGLDDLYPSNKVLVFNRWGNLIYEHDSSSDGPYNERPWDGTFKGEVLPVGSYFYIIEIKEGETKRGAVSIVLK